MSGKHIVVGIVAALLLVGVAAAGLLFRNGPCRDFDALQVKVGDTVFASAVARTEIDRQRGLAGCRQLPVGTGMYFPFDPPVTPTFWMKGMLIPLDFVWVRDGTVIGLERDVPVVPANSAPPQYQPPEAVDGVFEIGAGEAARLDITIGTPVTVSGL